MAYLCAACCASYRQQAAQLLQKYGVDASNPLVAEKGGEEEEEEESGDDDQDGTDLGSGSGMSDGSGELGEGESDEESEGEGEDEEAFESDEQREKLALLQQKLEEGLRQSESKQQQEGKKEHKAESKAEAGIGKQQPDAPASRAEQQHQRAVANGNLDLQGPQDLPYTIKMPDTYQNFAALVSDKTGYSVCSVQTTWIAGCVNRFPSRHGAASNSTRHCTIQHVAPQECAALVSLLFIVKDVRHGSQALAML